MKKMILHLIVLLFNYNSVPQDLGSPIVVSTLIGDKLDKAENEFFSTLFPGFEGFVEASFFMKPDSSLTAKIIYEQENIYNDSVINNFCNYNTLQKYVITNVASFLEKHGSFVEEFKIVFADDTEILASIFSVTENEVNTFNQGKNVVQTFSNHKIKKIVRRDPGTTSLYGITGLVLGTTIGALLGAVLIQKPIGREGFLNFGVGIDKTLASIIGGLLGAGIGYIVGTAIGNSVDVNEEYKLNSEGCFCDLDEYTILSMSFNLK